VIKETILEMISKLKSINRRGRRGGAEIAEDFTTEFHGVDTVIAHG
jgi:hypothetical protein